MADDDAAVPLSEGWDEAIAKVKQLQALIDSIGEKRAL